MSEESIVPVFIPPLASLMAAAEAKLNRPLTPDEAEGIRDGAVCMMMQEQDAQAMHASRGYRDVEPEDIWADWHRLRVQMTGDGFRPKLIWCLVGGEDFVEKVQPLLEAETVEHEWVGANPRMLPSFLASEFRLQPSLTEEDKRAIESHAHVLYLPSPNFDAGQAVALSARYLSLVARLLQEGGASGAKCESSGIAHGKARWLEFAAAGSLIGSYVQLPIGDSDALWTCGMHLLGRTDIIIGRDVFGGDEWEAARHLEIFATYLAEECPHFASGHTFSCNPDSPRLRATWEPCDRYDEDEFFHNPYGRLRLAPA